MKCAAVLIFILALSAALPAYRSKRQLQSSEETQLEDDYNPLEHEDDGEHKIADGSILNVTEDNQKASPEVGSHRNLMNESLRDAEKHSTLSTSLTNLGHNVTAAVTDFIGSDEELNVSATHHGKEAHLNIQGKSHGSGDVSVFSNEDLQSDDAVAVLNLASVFETENMNDSDRSRETQKEGESDSCSSSKTKAGSDSDSGSSTEQGKECESDSSSSSETETGSESDSNSSSEPGQDSESDSNPSSEPGQDSESDSSPGMETETSSESDSSSSMSESSESNVSSISERGKINESKISDDSSSDSEKDQSSSSTSSSDEDVISESSLSLSTEHKITEATLNPTIYLGTLRTNTDSGSDSYLVSSSEEDSQSDSVSRDIILSISKGENSDSRPQFNMAFRSSHPVWLSAHSGVQNNADSDTSLHSHENSSEDSNSSSSSSSSSEDSASDEDTSGNGIDEDIESNSNSRSSSEEDNSKSSNEDSSLSLKNNNIGQNLKKVSVNHLTNALNPSASSEGQLSESIANSISMTIPSAKRATGSIFSLSSSSESSSSSEESLESSPSAPSPHQGFTPSSSTKESETVELGSITSASSQTPEVGPRARTTASSNPESRGKETQEGQLSSSTEAQCSSHGDSSHSSSSKEGQNNPHSSSEENQSSISLHSSSSTEATFDIPNSSGSSDGGKDTQSNSEDSEQSADQQPRGESSHSVNPASVASFLRQLNLARILKLKPFLPVLITQRNHAGHHMLSGSISSSSESYSSSQSSENSQESKK